MKIIYSAKSKELGGIKMSGEIDLPLVLHQMILWVLMHPQDAIYLAPEYEKVRAQADDRNEAQKTHCGQDI